MAACCYCELRLKGRKRETKRDEKAARKQYALTPGPQMGIQSLLLPNKLEDITMTIQASTNSTQNKTVSINLHTPVKEP